MAQPENIGLIPFHFQDQQTPGSLVLPTPFPKDSQFVLLVTKLGPGCGWRSHCGLASSFLDVPGRLPLAGFRAHTFFFFLGDRQVEEQACVCV